MDNKQFYFHLLHLLERRFRKSKKSKIKSFKRSKYNVFVREMTVYKGCIIGFGKLGLHLSQFSAFKEIKINFICEQNIL